MSQKSEQKQECPLLGAEIYIYFLAFRMCVTPPPAVAVGHMDMIFGRTMGLEHGMLIFGKLRSEVKGQGHNFTKIRLFGPI